MVLRIGVSVLLATLVSGCRTPVEAVVIDAGPLLGRDGGSGNDAGRSAQPEDAGSGLGLGDGGVLHRVPALTISIGDGGEPLVVGMSDKLELDPVAALEVGLPVLDDYRLRLMDWTGAVVTSDDTSWPVDGGTVYRIVLPAPLKAGRTYSLELDAQSGGAIHDLQGRPIDDRTVTLCVRGEPEPEPAPAHGGKPLKTPSKKKKK